jgi:hypothetical protein
LPALSLGPALLASEAGTTTLLRGHLDRQSVQASTSPDAALTFVTEDGKKYQVVGDRSSNGQLRDPKLIGRTWELEGTMGSGNQFQIEKLYTIKDGKRHVVTYYCEICHIITHEPGLCMCCQADTELQETVDK